MNKKLITTDTDLKITTSTAIIVTVGSTKFIKDARYSWIDVFLTGGEVDEFITQEDNDVASSVRDINDLIVFAMHWIFDNVEIVKELEKETAPEVPVQEQPVNINKLRVKNGLDPIPNGDVDLITTK